ncbi:MAG: exodeoxyribonuclease VII small subunit [Lachnospiraceae bacterium]|nr:exodeoxyribonuclease VII small subunit [Lachnospiraceae bacterium]
MSKEEIEALSLEESFEKIEELMNVMSDDNIPLEKSFELYKEGMELLNNCNVKIDRVEKEVQDITNE